MNDLFTIQDDSQIRSSDNQHRLVFDLQHSALELHEVGAIRLLTGGPPPVERLSVDAAGAITIGGALTISGNVGIGTTPHPVSLSINGASAVGSALAVSGKTSLTGKLTVSGDLEVTGTVDGRDVLADGARLDQHLANTTNPHNTSAAQVGAVPTTGGQVTGSLTVAGKVGIGTTTPAKQLHIQGNSTAPFMVDQYLRPGLAITGDYPELNLFSGVNNPNHGPTIRLGAYNDNAKQTFKHWVIGTAGRNAGFLDIGFSDRNDPNPHAGIRNHNGRTVLTLLDDGKVGIGATQPQATLDVNGRIVRNGKEFSVSGDITTVQSPGSEEYSALVHVPWGSVDDWNIFVSPRLMGMSPGPNISEGDDALLAIECSAAPVDHTSSFKIQARYRRRSGSNANQVRWHAAEVNYLLVPR